MASRRFRQVDVFGAEPYLGNPVAVVLDAEGLDGAAMQRIARWTNLSETTFLLPPDVEGADYAVRIFTPDVELPFAGHPTLGTCHAWLEAWGTDGDGEVVQSCGAGLIRIRRDEGRLAFAAPPLVRSDVADEATAAQALAILGVDPADVEEVRWADNGPGWLGVLLRSADAVLGLRPDFGDVPTAYLGVAGPHPPGSDEALEVRTFFRDGGGPVTEDPVTGSFGASLAQWLLDAGGVDAPYVAAQGTVVGRAGRIHVARGAGGTIWVGGATVTCVAGLLDG